VNEEEEKLYEAVALEIAEKRMKPVSSSPMVFPLFRD
jgi:hypothetical protein